MSKIINENQRGLLFKNGIFIDILKPGKHRQYKNAYQLLICNINDPFILDDYPLEMFIKHEKLTSELSVIDVADETIAVHFIDNKFADCLTTGKYAFWNALQTHKFITFSMKETLISDEIPKYIIERLPSNLYLKVDVLNYQKARVYFDGKFYALLDEGTYYFWNNTTNIDLNIVDTRLLQMNVIGQEILSLDKVPLRINFVCQYKITDYVRIDSELENFEELFYVTQQLALREFISMYRLDDILVNKSSISQAILQKLKIKENDFFIEIYEASLKDIILPGEIREIMNSVLIAEKKAQANVITRREEVASTRSLLNTAKLMEENTTLYKLKELEYLEKICENVSNINVGASTDLLSQLSTILKG